MKKLYLFFLSIFLFNAQGNFAQGAKWNLEIFSGLVYNFPSPLKVYQDNYPTISLWAKYKTEPFKLPPYYDLRITRIVDDKGWDFEFFHHKIIMTNNPPDLIQYFKVTHGYNIFTLKRVLKKKGFIYHYGGGFVLTHPENEVREKRLNEEKGIAGKGYYFSGIVAEAAIDKRFYFGNYFYVSAESKLTASWSSVPIVDGNATIALLTLHVIFGLGLEL